VGTGPRRGNGSFPVVVHLSGADAVTRVVACAPAGFSPATWHDLTHPPGRTKKTDGGVHGGPGVLMGRGGALHGMCGNAGRFRDLLRAVQRVVESTPAWNASGMARVVPVHHLRALGRAYPALRNWAASKAMLRTAGGPARRIRAPK